MLRFLKDYNYIIYPIIIFIIWVTICLSLLNYYDWSWKEERLASLNKMAFTNSTYLTQNLDKTLSAAYILGSVVKQNNGEMNNFESYAKDIYQSIGNIDNLQLAPKGIIEKIYPVEGHEKALGHNILKDDARNKEALMAINSKKLTLAGPFELIQGGIAVIGRYPIFFENDYDSNMFWGFSSVLIYLDDLLEPLDITNQANKYEHQLLRTHPDTNKLEIISGNENITGIASDLHEVNVPNGKWYLVVGLKGLTKNAPLFSFGIFMSVILGLLVAFFLFYILKQPKILSELVSKKTAELKKLASHDTLTGLANRYEFESRAKNLLKDKRKSEREFILCYMDLDQFKVINDTCGHAAGDELLRQLSQLLMKTTRHNDLLARLGGDEFGIIFENCSLKDAQRISNKIKESIHNFQFNWKDEKFRIGVSMGLVLVTKDHHDLTELLKMADTACYIAKDSGRNRIHVYTPTNSEITLRQGEMHWIGQIHNALEHDLFCLYAQVIEPIDGTHGKAYEFLVRMRDTKGNVILPGAFIPAAERYSLMQEIDKWVVNKAFHLLAENTQFINQIKYISINLSGQFLSQDDYLIYILELLEKYKLSGEKICFEITETTAIANLSSASKFISALKEHGCSFALDDFGSGISSFGYLKSLDVDYLKIDGMFIKDMVDDSIDYAMVKSINEIGQLMGMKSVAEYVENDEIKGMLKGLGVNYVQGFGVGKPLDLNELLVRSRNVTNMSNLSYKK